MKTKLIILVIVITFSSVFLACNETENSQKYVNEEIGFSFEYPEGWAEEPPLSPEEVKRFANQNEFKVPVFTVTVNDKSAGVALNEVPERIINSMETTIPGSSGFKMLSRDNEKLSDNSEAVTFHFEWVWVDGETVMDTVFTAAYKGDKLIMVSGNTIRGLEFSTDEITRYCRTLNLSA